MLSPSDDRTTPTLHISVSDESNTSIYTRQPIVSSPTATADTRRHHHRQRAYRSDSTESVDKLGSGDFSRRTRDMTLVAESSQSFDLSIGISHEGTTISSPTCVEGQGTPVLSPIIVYPVAPERFLRHEKRRKM